MSRRSTRGADAGRALDLAQRTLTRAIERVNHQMALDDMGLAELDQLTGRFEAARNTFQEEYDKHVLRIPAADVPAVEQRMIEMEPMIDDVEVALMERRHALQPREEQPAAAAPIAPQINVQLDPNQLLNQLQVRHFREPKVAPFSGKPEDWPEFYDSFLTEVHNRDDLNNLDKLRALRRACSEHASAALGKWPTQADCYVPAWEGLVAKFQDEDTIHQGLMDKLMHLPKQENETAEGLREILDTVAITLQQLQAQNEPVQQWDSMILTSMRAAMSIDTLQDWEKERDKNVRQTYVALKQWLDTRARITMLKEQAQLRNQKHHDALVAQQKTGQKQARDASDNNREHQKGRFFRGNRQSRWSNGHDNHNKEASTSAESKKDKADGNKTDAGQKKDNPFSGLSYAERLKNITCHVCDTKGHTAYRCDELMNKSVDEKRRTLISKGVCIQCGRKHTGECRSPMECANCNNAKHILLVCPKRKESGKGTKRTN